MNPNQYKKIRLMPEIHRLAKIEACECDMTLEKWIEAVIRKELKIKNN